MKAPKCGHCGKVESKHCHECGACFPEDHAYYCSHEVRASRSKDR